jgi:hypothetical protein
MIKKHVIEIVFAFGLGPPFPSWTPSLLQKHVFFTRSNQKISKMTSIKITMSIWTNQFVPIIVIGIVYLIGKIGNYLTNHFDCLTLDHFTCQIFTHFLDYYEKYFSGK